MIGSGNRFYDMPEDILRLVYEYEGQAYARKNMEAILSDLQNAVDMKYTDKIKSEFGTYVCNDMVCLRDFCELDCNKASQKCSRSKADRYYFLVEKELYMSRFQTNLLEDDSDDEDSDDEDDFPQNNYNYEYSDESDSDEDDESDEEW